MIIREGLDSSNGVLCLENNCEIFRSFEYIQKKYGENKIIRIHQKDIENYTKEKLTHFNLEVSGHKKKEIYLLPKIVRSGYFKQSSKEEALPLLDFNGVRKWRCVNVIENISYDDLGNFDFKNSFDSIKSISDLKREILWRYSRSLPELNEDKILSLGVSITELEVCQ